MVAGGDSESCFLYLICLSVRKYFNLITTTYCVMQEVPNIYLCIHFWEKFAILLYCSSKSVKKRIIIRFNNGNDWIGTMNNGEMISFSDNWKYNNCCSENLVISTRRTPAQSRWVDSELCYLWYYIKLSCSAVSI